MKGTAQRFLDILKLRQWAGEEKGTAYIETVLLMPVFISLLMGVYDLGRGVTTNQKVIGASQIIGDLIARERDVTMAALDDIIVAGELAIEPYPVAPLGYDIVSVEFDDDGDPQVLWRVTVNTAQNNDAVESTENLGAPGDGILIVTTTYDYQPYFTHFVVDEINMHEVAFLHGRKSATITCADCPVP
jgi:Flp pilus assembly protein TadG